MTQVAFPLAVAHTGDGNLLSQLAAHPLQVERLSCIAIASPFHSLLSHVPSHGRNSAHRKLWALILGAIQSTGAAAVRRHSPGVNATYARRQDRRPPRSRGNRRVLPACLALHTSWQFWASFVSVVSAPCVRAAGAGGVQC